MNTLTNIIFICAFLSHDIVVNGKIIASKSSDLICSLSKHLVSEIRSYHKVVHRILKFVCNGEFKRKTFDQLEKFVDTFGARISGSETLEHAIDYMINITRAEGVNDIVTEDIEAPYWKRGEESIMMLEPRNKPIAVIGLGFSVSTPPEGITAEVVVVTNFTELDSMECDVIKGKIVLYDPPYTTYHETVKYRFLGASKAAEKGAVASLVRSITPFSIYTPHAGVQSYTTNVTKIPTAAITLEDTDLMRRLQKRKQKTVLKIVLNSTYENKVSRNTIIDRKGTTNPDKLVIVSGHIDSWDVGEGAMDDGGGLFISWATPVILSHLKLRSKRTIRSIFWTSEELGLVGAKAYEKRHREELDKINFIMESDEGTFKPRGLIMAGSQQAKCIVAEVLKLFSSINATELQESKSPSTDISVIIARGVPGASLLTSNERYYWFHHSRGDTLNVENPDDLDLCTAFWTAIAYVLADITVDIPRN